jgi:hypothetical protein
MPRGPTATKSRSRAPATQSTSPIQRRLRLSSKKLHRILSKKLVGAVSGCFTSHAEPEEFLERDLMNKKKAAYKALVVIDGRRLHDCQPTGTNPGARGNSASGSHRRSIVNVHGTHDFQSSCQTESRYFSPKLLNWRPRRDSNPCYRRERAMTGWITLYLQGSGRSAMPCKEQLETLRCIFWLYRFCTASFDVGKP